MTVHALTWRMVVKDDYQWVCHELVDGSSRRWGWVVNAAATGWMAHVGSWGQAADVGRCEPPVAEVLRQFELLSSAKDWIEQEISDQVKERR